MYLTGTWILSEDNYWSVLKLFSCHNCSELKQMCEILWTFFTVEYHRAVHNWKDLWNMYRCLAGMYLVITRWQRTRSYYTSNTNVTFLCKYRIAANFHNFCNPRPKCENKNRENLNMWTFVWTFELVEICTHVFCALVLLDLTMALYRYFKLADDMLPLQQEIC